MTVADRPDLPGPRAQNFEQRVHETLMVYLGRQGNPLDRGLTLRDLADCGMVELRDGFSLRNSAASLPIQPGPSVGGDATPDYTPPPTPTGFAATAGLTTVIVTHDAPTYTQGHGHLRTRLFGAQWVSGPLPTISNAVELAQFTGQVFVLSTPIGTTWRLWIRWETNDGVIGQPAGGTNGLEVTTGKIGNVDLGPLIVEAGNIANNAVVTTKLADAAVTAAKLIDNAVSAQKIVDGAIVTAKLADAGVTSGKLVDGAVVTNKLADASVQAAKIVDGAVVASKVAAKSISAEKLILTTLDNLAPNGNLATGDLTDWRAWVGSIAAVSRGTAGVPAGAPANNVLRLIETGGSTVAAAFNCARAYSDTDAWKYGIGCREGEQFRVAIDAARGATTGTLIVYLYWALTDGSYTSSTLVISSGGVTTTWAEYSGMVTVPANAVSCWPYVYWVPNTTGVSATLYTANLRVIRAASAELVVDGAITAAKVATNAITADKIAANAVAAGKIAANAVTANELAANSVVAGKIAANAVTADAIQASAITTAKLLVVDQGLCLNADPNTRDLSAWIYAGTMAVVNDTTSPTGGTVIEATNNGQLLSRAAAIDPTRNYEFRIWIKQQTGSSPTYLTVAFQDAAGTNISGGASGWPGAGTYFYFGLVNQTPSGIWSEYRISFGPNEAAGIPSGARFCNVGFLANYATTGTQRVTGIRLMQKADAELIVDGAITANKVAANAIVAGKIAANAIGASNIIAGTITGDRLAAATITAGNIASATITATQIASATITGDRIAGTTITAGNIAAGAISADKISSGTGGKNLLQNSGPNLENSTIQWLKTSDGNAGAGTRTFGASWSDWRPRGVGGIFVRAENWTPANGTVFADITNTHHNNGVFVTTDAVPCIPGRRYELHAWISAHRAAGEPRIFFYDAAGVSISETPGFGASNLAGNINDQNAQNYTGTARYGGFFTAPAGATTMAFCIRCYGRGLTDPYVFISQAYLGEATANQTEASPWSAGASSTTIIGDNIKSGTIQANRLSVSQLSAIAADVGLLRTASSGGRMEIQANQQRVYDTSGVERLRIGYLL